MVLMAVMNTYGTPVTVPAADLPSVMDTDGTPVTFPASGLLAIMWAEGDPVTFPTAVLASTMWTSLLRALHRHVYGTRGHRHNDRKCEDGGVYRWVDFLYRGMWLNA